MGTWDRHVQNAGISDLKVLRSIIPHTGVFDVEDPWEPLPASAKVAQKVSQLEQKEKILQSVLAEINVASDLQTIRKAIANAERVLVAEKVLPDDMEQWQGDISQAVRNVINQAEKASELHAFRKDKHVWSLGNGR